MNKLLSSLLFASIALVGCTTSTTTNSPLNFSYGVAKTGDFSFLPQSGVVTYSWRSDSPVAHVSKEYDADYYLNVIKAQIDQVLASKGYVAVSDGHAATMHLDFGIATENAMNDEQIFESTQIATGIQGDSQKGEKGSIYIAVFDSVGAFPRWRALAQGPTDQRVKDSEEREELKNLIGSMLDDLPPR
ncbi:DUF4136 domain-containing protein [Vibrio maritimus]|uniref:DUF4136 domain-containing protein n=1 Tax=Vibrio maritimus TaxID=990268 RepID=UPI001F3A8654|nr:DUF4136 domain-containing protein [Vibrio maritimus]